MPPVLTSRLRCVQKSTNSVRILSIHGGIRASGEDNLCENGACALQPWYIADLSTSPDDNSNQGARFRAKGLIQTKCR